MSAEPDAYIVGEPIAERIITFTASFVAALPDGQMVTLPAGTVLRDASSEEASSESQRPWRRYMGKLDQARSLLRHAQPIFRAWIEAHGGDSQNISLVQLRDAIDAFLSSEGSAIVEEASSDPGVLTITLLKSGELRASYAGEGAADEPAEPPSPLHENLEARIAALLRRLLP